MKIKVYVMNTQQQSKLYKRQKTNLHHMFLIKIKLDFFLFKTY